MSTFFPVECRCAVCGAENSYNVIGSTNAFGSPDLDLRPPEMQRSTMFAWVHECASCGYVAPDISKPTRVTREFLDTPSYRTCDGRAFRSKLAARFYRQYLIETAEGGGRGAFFAALHAAWACDDEGDAENARACRILALAELERFITDSHPDELENFMLVRADLLRRSRQFAELIRLYRGLRLSEPLLDSIRAFEVEKAEAEDDACYRVADVTGR